MTMPDRRWRLWCRGKFMKLNVCIYLLRQYMKLHVLSLGATLIAVLVLSHQSVSGELSLFWFIAFTGIIITGLVEHVYAVRVGLDVLLLQHLQKEGRDIGIMLAEIDDSLANLRLQRSARRKAGLAQRLQGCLGLLKTQAGLIALQFVIMFAAIAFSASGN